jgi:AraC-like DNA-binding protein
MEKDLKTFDDDLRTLGKDMDLPLVSHLGAVQSGRAYSVTWHYHQGCEVIFLLGGAASYEFRQHPPAQVLGGHFLVIPRGVEHRGIQNVRTPATICGMLLSPDFIEGWQNTPLAKEELRLLAQRLAISGPVVCRFTRDLRGVLERLMKAQREFEANRQSYLTKASLRLWACAVIVGTVGELTAPASPVSNELVVAAQDYLKQHLAEPIRMPDLIKHIGLCSSRLFQLFKSYTGLTPNDYLLRLRVEKAKQLLADPGPSITDVALESGFSSAQYFSGVFRKYAGQTPREYRLGACRQITA